MEKSDVISKMNDSVSASTSSLSDFEFCVFTFRLFYQQYDDFVQHKPKEELGNISKFELEYFFSFCENKTYPLTQPFNLGFEEINSIREIIYGWISPPFALITLLVNLVVCLVLLKKHMRTSTNIILASMALADTMTCIIPLPMFIYVFQLGNYDREWVPCSFLMTFFWLVHYLPTITHTASVWLTVTLAAQRYLFVRANVFYRSNIATESLRKTILCIFLVAIASINFHIWWVLPTKYESIKFPSTLAASRGTAVDACLEHPGVPRQYRTLYWWSRVLLIQILPCLALVMLNLLLLCKIRESGRTRKRLTLQHRNQDAQAVLENKRTNVMLFTVVAMFLVVEVPLTVLGLLATFEALDDRIMDLLIPIINLMLLVSYPVNFVIYCTMSRKFRETFVSLVASCCCTSRFLGQENNITTGTSQIVHRHCASSASENRTLHETVL